MAKPIDVDKITAAEVQDKQKTIAQSEDESGVSNFMPFRLLDLPEELWVRIGKMVIDEAPGVTTPDHVSEKLVPISPRPGAPKLEAAPWREITTLSTNFPPLPAITQTNGILRRELLRYYYGTKIDLVFHWRDVISIYALGAWVKAVDPKLRNALKSLRIVGLSNYRQTPALYYNQAALMERAHVDRLGRAQTECAKADAERKGLEWGGKGLRFSDFVEYCTEAKFQEVDGSEYEASSTTTEWKVLMDFK